MPKEFCCQARVAAGTQAVGEDRNVATKCGIFFHCAHLFSLTRVN